MGKKIERGIHELYAENPEKADWLIWGRKTEPVTRRGFLKNSGLLAMGTVLGASIPYAENMLGGLIPAALAQSDDAFQIPGKDGLIILNDRITTKRSDRYTCQHSEYSKKDVLSIRFVRRDIHLSCHSNHYSKPHHHK